MAKKYPGLYLYYDWMEAIEALGPKQGFQLILNLYHFSKDNAKPKPLDGTANIIQNLCIAQMERSKLLSEAGKAGNIIKAQKLHAARENLPPILQNSSLYIDPNDDPEELAVLQLALAKASGHLNS